VLRRFSVKIGTQERIVELQDLDGRLRVTVDGNARDIDARQVEPGVWSLMEGTRQTIAQVDGVAPKLTVAIATAGGDPIVVPVEVVPARSARLAALAKRPEAGALAPTALRSPMPGRVVKILVKVGDRVTVGQPAVVVEAMKMENELRATRAGTVQALRCEEGATVEAGQDLVVIGSDRNPVAGPVKGRS
jgi:glutaconyl-CoA/methylmalonyl-CoA decarboxylase subunit gamma